MSAVVRWWLILTIFGGVASVRVGHEGVGAVKMPPDSTVLRLDDGHLLL